MTSVTVRHRNQLTIPADIARAAGLGEGAVCRIELVNGSIVITPADSASAPSLDNFEGVARRAWGAGTADVRNTVTSDRASWNR